MRVSLFFDGNNYYRALRDYDQGLELNLERLAAWVTSKAGGEGARFVGAYYYTGMFEDAPGGDSPLAGFLDALETLTGFFVRREPRVRRSTVCRSCGTTNEYSTEKRVDTRLVAEKIQLAAVDGYDVAVLLSGDGDFVPAVQAVAALGKQVYLGVWPGQRVARELRAHSFGVLDLGQGVPEFSTGRRRPGSAAPGGNGGATTAEAEPASQGWAADLAPEQDRKDLDQLHQALLDEVRQAEAQLPYVSRWYFLNRWRGSAIPVDPGEREGLLVDLVSQGLVEEYEAGDAGGRTTAAIRSRTAPALDQ